jgi:hypothetical protein
MEPSIVSKVTKFAKWLPNFDDLFSEICSEEVLSKNELISKNLLPKHQPQSCPSPHFRYPPKERFQINITKGQKCKLRFRVCLLLGSDEMFE